MAQDKPQSNFDEVLAGIGNLDDLEPFNNQLLIGIHMKAGVTPGGIILTEKSIDEDKWQGKVGYVIKKGALCFKNDRSNDFGGQDVSPGDAVVYRVSDGFSIDVNGVHCRMIEDVDVKMRVRDPALIY